MKISSPCSATILTLISALALLPGTLRAQKSDAPAQPAKPDLPPAVIRMNEARKNALAALKAGDTAKAMSFVSIAIAEDQDDAPQELKLARKWGELSAALHNESNYKLAASTAEYAIRQVTDHPKAFDKKQGAESARLVAEIYDYILGDTANALKYYTQAAESDPRAAAGLARMKAIQAMIAAKAAEGELLRQRETARSVN